MEVTMANVVHHPHTERLHDTTRVYWAAGIGLALLTLLLIALSTTTTGHVISPVLMEPTLPFMPFVPML
jgi:hypothetical protein